MVQITSALVLYILMFSPLPYDPALEKPIWIYLYGTFENSSGEDVLLISSVQSIDSEKFTDEDLVEKFTIYYESKKSETKISPKGVVIREYNSEKEANKNYDEELKKLKGKYIYVSSLSKAGVNFY